MSEIDEILTTTAQITNNSALNESNHNNESVLDPNTGINDPYVGDSQHGTMALILLGALLGFQFLILYWKQKHYRSFQMVTLIGLWLIPMYIFGFQAHFWRFMTIWALYSGINSFSLNYHIFILRLVYKWFSFVYKVSYAVGITGYSIIMFTFFGLIQLVYTGTEVVEIGVLLLCYGLYFG
ncbi:11093_t:CDS:2, partial [Scutellospora calospora]